MTSLVVGEVAVACKFNWYREHVVQEYMYVVYGKYAMYENED